MLPVVRRWQVRSNPKPEAKGFHSMHKAHPTSFAPISCLLASAKPAYQLAKRRSTGCDRHSGEAVGLQYSRLCHRLASIDAFAAGVVRRDISAEGRYPASKFACTAVPLAGAGLGLGDRVPSLTALDEPRPAVSDFV